MAEPDKLNIDSIIQRLLEGEKHFTYLFNINCHSEIKRIKPTNSCAYVFVLPLCRFIEDL